VEGDSGFSVKSAIWPGKLGQLNSNFPVRSGDLREKSSLRLRCLGLFDPCQSGASGTCPPSKKSLSALPATALSRIIQFGHGIRRKVQPFFFTKKFVRSPCHSARQKCRLGAAYALHFFVRQKTRLFRLEPRPNWGIRVNFGTSRLRKILILYLFLDAFTIFFSTENPYIFATSKKLGKKSLNFPILN
jgi:hypothetical protein